MADLVRDFYTIADKAGAGNYLPEFSLAGAELAMKMGAQYVMPDACLTKDRIAIVLPDCLIQKDYTNLSQVEGFYDPLRCQLDWCAPWLFDYIELKEIKLRQPLRLVEDDERSTEFDDLFSIPTLEDYFKLVKEHNKKPHYEQVSVMLKMSYHSDMHLVNPMTVEFFVHHFVDLINENYGGEIVSAPEVPDLSEVRELVIVSSDEEVLDVMRQSTNLPLVWFYESGSFNSQVLMQVLSMNVQGFAPQALSIINNPYIQFLDEYNISVIPHTRKDLIEVERISEEQNYFLACCLKVDGIITDYVDHLLDISCDRIGINFDEGLSAWCDNWGN